MHHEVAETLFQCLQFDNAKMVVALNKKLRTLSRTNANGAVAVSEQQIEQLKHTITGKQFTHCCHCFRPSYLYLFMVAIMENIYA